MSSTFDDNIFFLFSVMDFEIFEVALNKGSFKLKSSSKEKKKKLKKKN